MNDYNKMLTQYFGAKKYTLLERIKRWFVILFESNHERLIREGKEHQEEIALSHKRFKDELNKPNIFLSKGEK